MNFDFSDDQKLLKEQGDKVSADEKTKIEDALKRLKDALAGTDIDAVKAAVKGKIMSADHPVAVALSNELEMQMKKYVIATS